MTKEIKIQVPEGMEIDRENSTFELIKFKPIEKGLPSSWEELEFVSGYDVDTDLDIIEVNCCSTGFLGSSTIWPSIEEAEASIALAQLCQLRDKYNDGWKPDWSDNSYPKYIIVYYRDTICSDTAYTYRNTLNFKSSKLRDKFLSNPEIVKLIEIAKPLL